MTHEQFVAAYLGSKTISEVVAKTGIDGRRASNAAAHLRYRGVLLPTLPKSTGGPIFSDKLDVEALNKFILER